MVWFGLCYFVLLERGLGRCQNKTIPMVLFYDIWTTEFVVNKER